LLEMVGSAINLNHYILDTSIIHHIALAPAVSPNWTTGKIYIAAGIIMMLLGSARFNSRDLQNE